MASIKPHYLTTMKIYLRIPILAVLLWMLPTATEAQRLQQKTGRSVVAVNRTGGGHQPFWFYHPQRDELCRNGLAHLLAKAGRGTRGHDLQRLLPYRRSVGLHQNERPAAVGDLLRTVVADRQQRVCRHGRLTQWRRGTAVGTFPLSAAGVAKRVVQFRLRR